MFALRSLYGDRIAMADEQHWRCRPSYAVAKTELSGMFSLATIRDGCYGGISGGISGGGSGGDSDVGVQYRHLRIRFEEQRRTARTSSRRDMRLVFLGRGRGFVSVYCEYQSGCVG